MMSEQPDVWRLHDDLDRVLSPRGVSASDDHLFRGAFFARDALQVVLDVLPWRPTLAERVLVNLAALQGTRFDLLSEEEPGRIHHEARRRHDGPRLVDDAALAVMRAVATAWSLDASAEEVVYYGSIDATCQFIRTAAQLHRLHGSRGGLLDRPLRHRDGRTTTLRTAVTAAAGWIERRVAASDLGLLESHRSNPAGIANQVLRDSGTAYVHADGSAPNAAMPIASVEVQGLAFAALHDATALLGDAGTTDRLDLAESLRQQTLRHFWLDRETRFAAAVGRGPDGAPRPLTIRTSLPAELLESGLLTGLPEEHDLVSAVARDVLSPHLLTAVGVRSMSAEHAGLFDYWTYHGAATCWMVSTNIIARGLRQHGLTAASAEVDRRLLAGVAELGTTEFIYVHPDDPGLVYRPIAERRDGVTVITATNVPESPQAWSVSAALRASRLAHTEPSPPPARDWSGELDASLAAAIDQSEPRYADAWVDRSEGRRREAAWHTHQRQVDAPLNPDRQRVHLPPGT